MIEEGVPAIYGIDTRALTKELREHGSMLGKIIIDDADEDQLILRPFAENEVDKVSCKEIIEYKNGEKKVVL